MLIQKKFSVVILSIFLILVGCTGPNTGLNTVFGQVDLEIVNLTVINVPCNTADLIAAINSANATPAITTLNLEANCEYVLDSVENSDDGDSALPGITSQIVINGNGATFYLERSTNYSLRIIFVAPNGDLTLNSLFLYDGLAQWRRGYHDGGAILNQGVLTINDLYFNHFYAEIGGVIYNAGSLVIENSTFENNAAIMGGGGIFSTGNVAVDNSSFLRNRASGALDALYGGGAIQISGGVLSITNCIFNENEATSDNFSEGGAIFIQQGTLTVESSVFTGNSAHYRGGAIESMGIAYIYNSEFFDNSTNNYGGAIMNNGGNMEIINTSIHNSSAIYGSGLYSHINSYTHFSQSLIAGGVGGAFHGATDSEVVIENSTISNNIEDRSVDVQRAALMTHGVLTIIHSTIADNTGFTGIVVGLNGAITIQNSIIANHNLDCDIQGGINAIKQNIDTDGSCAGFTITDDPLLAPLADNGGPTMTHALLPHSPALDTATGSCLAVDQRGLGRPAGLACDIGAYEEGALIPTPTPSTKTMMPMIAPVVEPGNCLAGPGPEFPVVQYLAAGENLTALGQGPEGDWVIVASPYYEGAVCWVLELALGMPIDPYDMPIDPYGMPNGDQCMPIDPLDIALNLAGMPIDPYGALPACPAPPVPGPSPSTPTPTPEPDQPVGCWIPGATGPDSGYCEIPCEHPDNGPCP